MKEAKRILDKFATVVVPKKAIFVDNNGQAGVNQEKCLYYEKEGYREDYVLWIAPKNCLRIEFEDTPTKNHRFMVELESSAKTLGFDYCITGHRGKSDYFNMFNIKDLPLGEDNKNAKLLLVDMLLPAVAKDQLDRTNLGWTLSPVIEHPHWKPKYNGTVHKILRGDSPADHKNEYPKELLKQLKKAKRIQKTNITKIKYSNSWVEDFLLNYCCNNPLPKGSRHFIIEKNLMAFIIFRKDKEEIKEKYYKAQERKHDSMRTWEVAILRGDYANVSAGEIANFIKEHSINYAIPIQKKEELEGDDKQRTSLLINKGGGIFAEQVYDPITRESCFAVYDIKTDKVTYQKTIHNSNLEYFPNVGEELHKKAIHLPIKAEEYESDEKLDEEILRHIGTWLDIPREIKLFALWNIKRSWVYERFHSLNYLRAMGDFGTGKSRYLDTLGYIHYKSIATSGASTAATVFRAIDKWRGTLIMDEADFGKSDEAQDMIKIINLGYEEGKFVMRCDQNNANIINFFDPYCPKILATRRSFDDKATESRCITHVMTGTTKKIPYNLNEKFWESCQKIRNKLLMWRFRNYHKIDPDVKIDIDRYDLEPRVKQIVTSFISLFIYDKKQLDKFWNFILEYQETIIDERQSSWEGQVVMAIFNLVDNGNEEITALDIIVEAGLTDFKGNQLKPRALTSCLKSLGFGKTILKRVGKTAKRCIPLGEKHLTNLFKRYRNDVTFVTVVNRRLEILRKQQKQECNRKNEKNEFLAKNHGASVYSRYNRYNVTQKTSVFQQNLSEKIAENQPQKVLPNESETEIEVVKDEPETDTKMFSKEHIKIQLSKQLQTKEMIEIQAFVNNYPDIHEPLIDEIIEKMTREGEIFSPKSGFIKRL